MEFDICRTLLLLCMLAFVFAFGIVCGVAFDQYGFVTKTDFRQFLRTYWFDSSPKDSNKSDRPKGEWERITDQSSKLSRKERKKLKSLRAMGYTSGSEKAKRTGGVVTYRADKSYGGINFYVSGHGPEAFLIDMKGTVLHKWRLGWSDAFKGNDPTNVGVSLKRSYAQEDSLHWRKAAVKPDGTLYAIFEGLGIIKINRDSELQWALANHAHHDLVLHEDGSVFVLTREMATFDGYGDTEEEPILEEFIVKLSPEGEVEEKISILKSINESPYSAILDSRKLIGEIFHTNSLDIVKTSEAQRSSLFQRGDILISINNMNLVGLIDGRSNEMKWVLKGLSFRQHDAEILPNGNILFFDNHGSGPSRVLEIKPSTQKIIWSYEGNKHGNLYTKCCGANQRLPNGNTLITESESGRAFEVTPKKEIVWEFLNPHRAGNKNQYVGNLFELKRFEESYFGEWL